MKKIMPTIANVFFALFGAGVIALLMSYTFSALAHVFPDNFTAQIMGMLLYDLAALAWLGAFIYLCKSVAQYAFAFIGFVFGLGGSLLMVAIEVMLGGQQMIDAPEWVNQALIYGFIFSAIVHVTLYYSYKLAAPEISADISLGFETAQITEEAMKQAEAQLMRERGTLGGTIAPRLISNVRRNLGLPVAGDVIDAPSWVNVPNEAPIPVHFPRSMPTATTPQRQKSPGLFDRLRAVGQVLVNPGLINQPAQTSAHNVPMPINQAGQAPAQSVPTPINQPQQEPAQDMPTPIVEEPRYNPAGLTPITPQESEAAELQPVPLPVGFSGNGNGKHPSE